MFKQSEISNEFDAITNRLMSMDQNIIGTDLQKESMRLAKDDKGAMVNDVVDQYFKQKLTNEYLQNVKNEHNIVDKDIVTEIVKRQIEKALGK